MKALLNLNESFFIAKKPNDDKYRVIIGKLEICKTLDTSENNIIVSAFDNSRYYKFCDIYFNDNIKVSDIEYINRCKEESSLLEIDYKEDIFNKNFDKFHTALTSNNFEKIVLSHKIEVNTKGDLDYIDLYLKTCKAYPNAFVYLFVIDKNHIWLGASPEILIKGKENNYKTIALAGTKWDKDTEWDSKNKYEHNLVSEHIESILNKTGIKYKKSDTETINAGKLYHLQTSFDFNITDTNIISSLINQLHPTPAICGLPQQQSKDYILKNEGYNRDLYSGLVGYIADNEINIYVNLRCMCIKQNHIDLYAGCGIVQDSQQQKEFEEIKNKFQTMLYII